MTLRDVLNKIRWNRGEKGRVYEITYIHRGQTENRRTISFSIIKEIHSSWFTYTDSEGEDVTIPFHRVLEISDAESGKPIWKSRRRR